MLVFHYCHNADKFRIQLEEGENSAQYLNSFFSYLADELHKQPKARLEDALSRIEEETQEAEV